MNYWKKGLFLYIFKIFLWDEFQASQVRQNIKKHITVDIFLFVYQYTIVVCYEFVALIKYTQKIKAENICIFNCCILFVDTKSQVSVNEDDEETKSHEPSKDSVPLLRPHSPLNISQGIVTRRRPAIEQVSIFYESVNLL